MDPILPLEISLGVICVGETGDATHVFGSSLIPLTKVSNIGLTTEYSVSADSDPQSEIHLPASRWVYIHGPTSTVVMAVSFVFSKIDLVS